MERIVLGGGCFWCLEAAFVQLRGVTSVVSGYAGGATPQPTYEAVCSGSTGHAEVVKVTFDPTVLTLRDVLTVFFGFHDPTTLNRQGHDIGTQYRSVIFAEDAVQQQKVLDFIDELSRNATFPAPITTVVATGATFYAAEEYHQRYYEKNPDQGYCSAVISPKLSVLRQRFSELL